MVRYIFGERHKEYMKRCLRATVNVAEGSVRAGKTVDHVFVFATLLERSPDRLHLATGATAAAAKLNIGDCNGLGLEGYFGSRARWGKFRGCECLRIATRTGEKVVIFAGGKNADSYKKIRGNSYGMWIATEINLHHDSMIKEAFNRQLAARDRRVFWDLNPTSPTASIYRDYIDLYAEKTIRGELPEGFYNYGHFTVRDNPAVSPQRLAEIIAQYDPESVWYRRDILGERCAAEGLVYPYFASHRGEVIIEREKLDMSDVRFINIGVDFGGNRSKTAFAACAVLNKGGICMVADGEVEGRKGEIDPVRVCEDFLSFVRALRRQFPDVLIKYAFCDSEAQYLINGLRKFMRRAGDSIEIGESKKCRIRDRIDFVCSMMAQGRFRILSDCTRVIRGVSEAVFDPDAVGDVRLDNFSSDIDILDAMEYSFERYMRNLM